MSLEWVKLGISNYVLTLIVASTSVRMIDYPPPNGVWPVCLWHTLPLSCGDVWAVFETGTRTSLEDLRRRLQHASRFVTSRAGSVATTGQQVALLIVDIELAIPRIVTRPSLEETQTAVSRAVQTMLATTEHVTPWQHFNQYQLQLQKVQLQRQFADDAEPCYWSVLFLLWYIYATIWEIFRSASFAMLFAICYS